MMYRMGTAARRMHIRRVKDYTIYFTIAIREIPSIDSLSNVSCKNIIITIWYFSPEYPFSKCNICNNTILFNI